MKAPALKIAKAVGPIFTLSHDDETAIYDYTCFPPAPDKVDRIK